MRDEARGRAATAPPTGGTAMDTIGARLVWAFALSVGTTAALAAGPTANTSYGYAQVLRVEPAYELRTVQTVDPECLRPERAPAPPGRAVGACRPRSTPVRKLVGYDVEYTYKGDTYMSRLPYDPGSRLRIRIEVTPDDARAPSRVAPEQRR
jgi:uncharacterized protein YcfJ